ncbi:MAG: arginine N-succinyltransferase [Alphaproteobacteria bacterium]|nr:arginine N-succinyltransferase [Alphaproteobacteria bacterium]
MRPATLNDHDAILALARQAGFGMTSLPPDAAVLRDKIEASVASFAGKHPKAGQESFLFVLEDSENAGHIAGTCGIKAHIGLSQPFYSYKLTTITQVSSQLDIFSKQTMLQVTNDLTGATEVGSLFLQPTYRRDRLGKMMSLSRFMFMAAFPKYFADQVIAEMRGVHDVDGNAPFYNALPKKFFEMDFAKADYINATQGNQFINDLMPKYPIYLSLLPKSARRVVGEVNAASEPAKIMLERQGFKYTGYVDIFDGGPTLIADRQSIDVIRQGRLAKVVAIAELPEETSKFMISNDRFEGFRCAVGRLKPLPDGTLQITPRLARRAGVSMGDNLRYYPL